LEELAPNIVQCVPQKIINKRSVHEAMQGGGWAADIKRALGWLALAEYLELWNILADVNLDGSYDVHQWKFEASGIFSTSSAYCSYFVGSIPFEPWRKVWKSWATGKCKTFMWLAIKN
jgi:hypothetical protein